MTTADVKHATQDDAFDAALPGDVINLNDTFDAALLDLDGCVFEGTRAITGAIDTLLTLRGQGKHIAFATNNASRTPQQVADHLESVGVRATADEVVNSPYAAAQLLLQHVEPGSKVLVIGGDGLVKELNDVGYEIVRSAEDSPAAVVQGFHRTVGWEILNEGNFAIRAGALWLATNLDPTLPTERGPSPGNGSLVSVLRMATGQEPLVAGKPEPALFQVAAERCGATSPLVGGDRLDTDIAGGNRAGYPTLLVLSGSTSARQAVLSVGVERPTYVSANLTALVEPITVARRVPGFGLLAFDCGDARAEIRQGRLSLQRGTDPLDTVRAACAAVWSLTGRDRAEFDESSVPEDFAA
ncbi:HAD-IIA family hydrolase [Micrococcales bacterium 31B]|nr:HAD-IIA family hydrolase [Micrococcales bacterium 31B]